MKIYLDYIFLINFIFDFLLLLSVSVILKRNVKLKRIIMGAFIGGLSIFILFIPINNIQLFILKVFISILMVLISFSFKNIKYTIKNLIYLYMNSMVLGGALYFLNIQFSYKNEGLIFYHNGFSINMLVLIILSPIIIYTYIKQTKHLKNFYTNCHKVNVTYNKKTYNLNAFLDTGNRLVSPVAKIPIVIVKKAKIKEIKDYIIVPYNTMSGSSLIKCVKVEKFEIDNKIINKKVLLGLIDSFEMEGIDCILNPLLMEEI